jgi:hypothetical protein
MRVAGDADEEIHPGESMLLFSVFEQEALDLIKGD